MLVVQELKQTNKPWYCFSNKSELKLKKSFSKGAGSVLAVWRGVAGKKGNSQSMKSKYFALKGQNEEREREEGTIKYR